MSSIAAILVLCTCGQLQEEFRYEFGSGLHPALHLVGHDTVGLTKEGRSGLVELSAERAETGPLGLSPRFRINGDFEITVAYEILRADEPDFGFGAGVKIWAQIGPSQEAQKITLAHLHRPSQGYQFIAMLNESNTGKYQKFRDTSAKAGMLRLVRNGEELVFLCAEGATPAFEEFARFPISASDIYDLNITVNTHGAPSALSVRLIDFQIRAQSLPSPAAPSQSSAWPVVTGICLVLLIVAGLLFWRRSRLVGKNGS